MKTDRAPYSHLAFVAVCILSFVLTACSGADKKHLSAPALTLAAEMPPDSRSMKTGGPAPAPFGHVEFCQRQPQECQSTLSETARAETPSLSLDRKKWRQLQFVNSQVNNAIVPVTDRDLYNRLEYWTFPTASGDCEDYALLKRRQLIEKGWPAETLLLSVAIEADGNAHAVLVVTTAQGDYVLDNQSDDILPWTATPYLWEKRQSAQHPAIWLSLKEEGGPLLATSATKRRAE